MKNNTQENKNQPLKGDGGTDPVKNAVDETLSEAFGEGKIGTDQSEGSQEPIYELSLIISELKENQKEVRENTVHTSAIEKVLLEHGLKPEIVESTLDKIREVDNQLWEDYDK